MDLTEVPGAAAFRRHPWEVARARFFARVAQGAGAPERPVRVLDVGAGDGYLARQLLARLPPGSAVACVDANYGDDDLARFASPPTPGLSFARERPAGAFDVTLLLDVIEHVEDDRGFLGDIVGGAVPPGGAVLVSVPAWELLYSQHDVALKHFRRYAPAQCRALLEASGLDVVRDGGLFHSLLLPRAVQRLAEVAAAVLPRAGARGAAPADAPANLGQWRGGALASAAVGLALAADNRLSDVAARLGRQLPGLSYWALCRKRGA
jgi:hypothetical protein